MQFAQISKSTESETSAYKMARLPKTNREKAKITAAINARFKQQLKLGEYRNVDIIDRNGVLQKEGGIFIPTYTKAGDSGGGYLLEKGTTKLVHITGTGIDNSYIPAHTIDLSDQKSGKLKISVGLQKGPKLSCRTFKEAISMLGLQEGNQKGIYRRRGFSGSYRLQRELDGSVSVHFSGGTHLAFRNDPRQRRRQCPPQTLVHGNWNLHRRNLFPVSRTAQTLESVEKQNHEHLKNIHRTIADNRKARGHDGGKAGADTRCAGSGVYFADSTRSCHSIAGKKSQWTTHSKIRLEEVKKLDVPKSNSLRGVLERRAVARPYYERARLSGAGESYDSYSFICNYNSKVAVLHLVDTNNDAVLTPLARHAYRLARETEGTRLRTDTWQQGVFEGRQIRTLVRSDGSILEDRGRDVGAKRYCLYVPGLSQRPDGSSGVYWNTRFMRVGGPAEVDFVETESSRKQRSAARRNLERHRSKTTAALSEWRDHNLKLARQWAKQFLLDGKKTGYYPIDDLQVAARVGLRVKTSAALYEQSTKGAAFVFTRRYFDKKNEQVQEGLYFIRERDLNPKNDPTVAQAYRLLKQDLKQGRGVGHWHPCRFAGFSGAELQVRSDGSIALRSQAAMQRAWFSGFSFGTRILRPVLQDGGVAWESKTISKR